MSINTNDYNKHSFNMPEYEKSAAEYGMSLREFLVEKVGVDSTLAEKLLTEYQPEIYEPPKTVMRENYAAIRTKEKLHKNKIIAAVLALLFGPLGMLYVKRFLASSFICLGMYYIFSLIMILTKSPEILYMQIIYLIVLPFWAFRRAKQMNAEADLKIDNKEVSGKPQQGIFILNAVPFMKKSFYDKIMRKPPCVINNTIKTKSSTRLKE